MYVREIVELAFPVVVCVHSGSNIKYMDEKNAETCITNWTLGKRVRAKVGNLDWAVCVINCLRTEAHLVLAALKLSLPSWACITNIQINFLLGQL
jgi:hypothetical protein